MTRIIYASVIAFSVCVIPAGAAAGQKKTSDKKKPAEKPAAKLNVPPPGFTALFNGKNLEGWQAVINPKQKAKLQGEALQAAQKAANAKVLPSWQVKEGILVYAGQGGSLQTVKNYGNFELLVDWKIHKGGDSGIYLRGNPQVQIWDRKEGSGGLYNNKKEGRNPIVNADYPPEHWNTFRIIMKGDKVTVFLNGVKVVNNVPLENYWDKGQPLPETGPIELQHHGNELWFRNIFIKELD